jgi:hypothetical protein
MKRLVLQLLALCKLTGCADVTWYRAQVGLEATAIAGLACDGGESQQYLSQSRWQEINPILGAHPSNAALWGYLAGVGVVMLGVDHTLDLAFPKWGPRIATFIAGAVAVTEIKADAVNMSVGASFCGTGPGGPWKPLPDGEPGAVTAR